MALPILSVDQLHFKYDEEQTVETLTDINFAIEEEEWIAVIGHNGSGKSTLAKLIDGLLEANSGTITVDQLKLSEETVWDVRKKIGLVFQNPDNQFVGATVEDDVAFGLENAGIPHDVMVERVNWALEQVGMSDYKDKEPANLSGGQKQRVALAGVLALQPKIIILDEAMSMLDPEGRREVMSVIQQVKAKQHLTIMSITHDIDEAALADRILVMKGGQLVGTGTPAEIFSYGTELIEMGLDVPFPEKLKQALRDRGFPVPHGYLSTEGMVDWLCKFNSTK
ncbi:MAG: energy-coupling factor ABC transporter ATP-binding protein [Aerococcus sp.]|nr:energy-coupling factor ABC transporter ATP-binding protein [Aerococcus sp.]